MMVDSILVTPRPKQPISLTTVLLCSSVNRAFNTSEYFLPRRKVCPTSTPVQSVSAGTFISGIELCRLPHSGHSSPAFVTRNCPEITSHVD